METEIKVGEAMEPNVVTVEKDAPVNRVAKIMAQKKIGSVVVMEKDKPAGIVTERDIVFGVVAKDKKPSDVLIRDIMSSPLKSVNPHMTLKQASRLMAKYNIRRLPVIERDRLVGIITNKDILAISPEMLEILEELSRINASKPEAKERLDKGTCETCGDYMVTLYEVDGSYVCESCREDMLGGE
jgi:CBS domain-containing protein